MRSTLLLDQGYQPVDVISWQEAIRLIFLDKAEVVEEYEDDIRSAFLVIKMPAVVRLVNMFRRNKKRNVKFSRVSIYSRDDFSCQYCGVKKKMKEFTFDHVVPRSRGGKTNWENIVTCCVPCNSKKNNRTPEEAKMVLKKRPVRPDWIPAFVIRLNQTSVPDAWRDYLYWNTELDEE
jgi:5-methylcytosine-specific restriction endonuclease McrA